MGNKKDVDYLIPHAPVLYGENNTVSIVLDKKGIQINVFFFSTSRKLYSLLNIILAPLNPTFI